MNTIKFLAGLAVAGATFGSFAEEWSYTHLKTTSAEETFSGVQLGVPRGEGTTFASTPFSVRYDASNLHYLQLATGSATVDAGAVNTHPVVEFTDYSYRVAFIDQTLRIDFDSGTFNFLDPFGETWRKVPYLEFLRCNTSWKGSELYVHGEHATTRWPEIRWAGWGTVGSRFVLEGGEHVFGGAFYMPYGSANFNSGVESAYDLVITNGAKVVFNSAFAMGTANMGVGTSENKTMNLMIADGASVVFSNTVSLAAQGTYRVEIDHAAAVVPNLIGNGSSSLIANGASIRPRQNPVGNFIGSFTAARIGDDGLTIDSVYDLAIPQSFADAGDCVTGGRLVLAGSGRKTFSAVGSVSAVELAGGKADFGNAALGKLVFNGGSLVVEPDDAPIAEAIEAVGTIRLVIDDAIASDGDYTLLRYRSATCASGSVLDNLRLEVNLAGGKTAVPCVSEADGVFSITITVRDPVVTEISLATGTETDSADRRIAAGDKFRVTVADGAALTLAGTLGEGGLDKTGAGRLVLSGADNLFLGSLCLFDGCLSATSVAALGYDAKGAGIIRLQGGTLELDDPVSPAVLRHGLNLASGSESGALVIKTDVDTVVTGGVSADSGALFKRGAGKLVIEAADSLTMSTGSGTDGVNVSPEPGETAIPFPEDGAAPSISYKYGGLNIVEGEMVIRGTGAEPAQVELLDTIRIGIPTTVRSAGAANPSLVLDHVNVLQAKNDYRAWLTLNGGVGANSGNTAFTGAKLVLTNGTTLTARQIYANRSANSATLASEIVIDGSVLDASGWRVFANANGRGANVTSSIAIRNGALYTQTIDCYGIDAGNGRNGSLTFTADGGVLAKNGSGEPLTFYGHNEATSFSFVNGSRFCCDNFRWNSNTPGGQHHFVFDDSEWYMGDADATVTDVTHGSLTTFTVTGRGLVLAPPANRTYTFQKDVSGTGGLVKRGAGRVVMPVANLKATGTVRLEAGTLDFGGGTLDNAVALAGGTLKDVTLTNGAIGYEIVDGAPAGVPAFDGVTFPAKVRFDTGSAVLPSGPFTFATYTGAAPDVSGWRSGKDANGMRLSFTAAAGVITANAVPPTGAVLIFR